MTGVLFVRRCGFSHSSLLIVAISLPIFIMLGACAASGQSTDARLKKAEGTASYYGEKFAGEATANGETFDPDEYTAAHPSLPFNTKVRVIRIDSEVERSVTVRINDRGPYAGDRIIDVSEAAAEELGMINAGLVTVRLEIVDRADERPEEPNESGGGW